MRAKIALCLVLLVVVAIAVLMLRTEKAVVEPEKEEPLSRLLDDTAFLADLERSGKRGLKGIAVVAPASGLRGENVEKVYALAERFGVAFSREALDPAVIPYTANSDAVRLRLLSEALNDPETEVVWAMRGGYGVSRILPDLAVLPPPPIPKVFIGYSDLTFLHLYLQKLGWKTVHGAMFWELSVPSKDPENFRQLAALLSGRNTELRHEGLRPFNAAAREQEEPIRAVVTGGNLTCLTAAVGTPWALEATGRIVVMEDVKERGYKLDRMFTQLRAAGQLDGVAAVILGTFSAGDDDVEFALERFAAELPAPVFRTDLFGHGVKNRPLVFNAPAVIEKSGSEDGSATLIIQAGTPPEN